MNSLRIVKKLGRNSSNHEIREIATLFNENKEVINHIVNYLEDKILEVDKELMNPESLYKHAGHEHYVAFKLADRKRLFDLRTLLTEEVKILDDDQSGD